MGAAIDQAPPFHDRSERDKPQPRYHTDDACPLAQRIPPADVRPGSGKFYLCEHCAALAVQDQRRETRPDPPIS